MASCLPTPEQFWSDPVSKPSAAEWHSWKTTFTNYVDMLCVFNPTLQLTEDHKVKLLHLHLGQEGRRLFDALDLKVKSSLQEAFLALDKFWSVRVNTFVSRYKFSLLKQTPGEDLDTFISRLLCASRSCDYSSIPAKKVAETFLVQQLIFGVCDSHIREALLSTEVSKLSWDHACDVARSKADLKKLTETFHSVNHTVVSRINSTKDMHTAARPVTCYRCGSSHHKANYTKCPAINSSCRLCKKKGHFAKVCRSHTVADINSTSFTSEHTADVTDLICTINPRRKDNGCSLQEPKLPSADSRLVYFVMQNSVIPLTMEFDSASPITIIPHTFYAKYFSHVPLQQSSYIFGSYSNDPICISGFIIVTLFLQTTMRREVAVYVSRTNSKPLFGRNAMVQLHVSPRIDRMLIASVRAEDLCSTFPKLFQEDIGSIPRVKHRIVLKPNAVPFAISQPRPVPLAKKEAVSKSLQCMAREGLIEQIECSEWVHPLVAVMKKDGDILVCTDLRKLNEQIVVEKFPLPTADELIVKLSGAKLFSKLDLRSAYFHMSLTEDSKRLRAFLTQDGLYTSLTKQSPPTPRSNQGVEIQNRQAPMCTPHRRSDRTRYPVLRYQSSSWRGGGVVTWIYTHAHTCTRTLTHAHTQRYD